MLFIFFYLFYLFFYELFPQAVDVLTIIDIKYIFVVPVIKKNSQFDCMLQNP